MNERLSSAIECPGQGLKVFPLQENKKKPLEGSRGFKDATDDITQIQTWWGNHPEYNIGIRTGEVSNLTVIDVDGEGGMESIQTIRHLLPENTRVIKTPHGYHLYFDYSSEFTTGVGFLDGLDVRNNGGYVVAPASVVECDKQDCDGEHGNEYTVYRDVPRQRINVVPGVFKGGARTQVASTDTRENIPQLLKGVELGVRDQTLTSLVGKLFHMGLPEDLVRPILYTFADNCSPPLEHRVVDEKIQRMPKVYEYPEPSPIDEYVDPLEAAYRRTGLLRPRDWLHVHREPVEDLVEGLVKLRSMTMLSAPIKAGKTVFAKQLAMCVAKGWDFLGRKVKRGGVIYLAIEEPPWLVEETFRTLGLTDDDDLQILFGRPNQELAHDIQLIVQAEKPQLLILDTITRVPRSINYDTGDYMGNSQWLEYLLYLAHETGTATMPLYHASRSGRSLERYEAHFSILGSTGIGATYDQLIYIKVESDGTRAFGSEGRFESIEPTLLTFDKGSEWLGVLGDRSEVQRSEIRNAMLGVVPDDGTKVTRQAILDATEVRAIKAAAKTKNDELRGLESDGLLLKEGNSNTGYVFSKTSGSQFQTRGQNGEQPVDDAVAVGWEGEQPTVWEV